MSTVSSSNNSERAYIRSAQETEEAYREKIKSLQEDHSAEKESISNRRAEERADLKDQYEKELHRGREELSKAVAYEKDQAREEVAKLQSQMYDKQGQRFAKDSRDLSQERQQLSKFRDDMKRDFAHQEIKDQQKKAELVDKMRTDFSNEAKNALNEQKRGLDAEMGRLNREVQHHRAHEHRKNEEIANAREKTVRDTEGVWAWQNKQLQDNFEKESVRNRHANQLKEDFQERRLREVEDIGIDRMTEALNRQRKEFAEREGELHRENSRNLDNFNRTILDEKVRASRQQQQLQSKGENDRSGALQAQKTNFTRDLEQKGDYYQSKIVENEQAIQKLRNPSSAKDVPQYARERIENDLRQGYEQKYATLNEGRKIERESILKDQVRERIKIKEDTERAMRNQTRNATKALDEEKSRMVGAYLDLQSLKEEERLRAEHSKAKQLTQLTSNHTRELESQSQHLRDAVEENRYVEELKSKKVVEDAELNQRQLARNFAMELNSARREMDKRLLEQRDGYESQIIEMKREAQAAVREAERKGKSVMEERIRTYEHQIKQMEQTQKERERFLTEHYEDEIDRMKRTNARLIQKKS